MRGLVRLLPIVGALCIIVFVALGFYDERLVKLPIHPSRWTKASFSGGRTTKSWQDAFSISPSKGDSDKIEKELAGEHRIIYSVSTANKKYFSIQFGDEDAINPNIIPHPILDDTWIIVAQLQRSDVKNTIWFAELVCDAVFKNDKLACVKAPMILPIASTLGENCAGDLDFFKHNIGPHDARVFYGPGIPYTIYGSQSDFTCFGQWIQDFRMLVDWGYEGYSGLDYRHPTELQRPLPWSQVEKNWFVFWDKKGQIYAHFDVTPKRVYAKLDFDGSIGPDLGPSTSINDGSCMGRYMPKVAEELESVHQATNSLSITLCNRSDSSCRPNDSNTFIFTIFQHKSYYNYHGVYEPYIMLFKQTEPFELYAISTKPMWIHGRDRFKGRPRPGSVVVTELDAEKEQRSQTEMFYVTSMSWKRHGQKYHGYSDDVLFIAFGIEDSRTAGIDVVVGDLLLDLGLCSA